MFEVDGPKHSDEPLRWRGTLLVFLSVGLACGASSPSSADPERSSNVRQTAPISKTVAPASARLEDAGDPTRPDQVVALEDVVALATARALWPMDLATANKRLSALAPTHRERSEPISDADKLRFGISSVPDDVTLVAGPSGALQHAEISYVGGTDRAAFGSAGFSFVADSIAELHQRIRALVSAKLGGPKWVHENEDQTPATVGWKLRGKLELELCTEQAAGQARVTLNISAPDGP